MSDSAEKLVNPPVNQTKMVKIRTLRPIRIGDTVTPEGQEVHVTEDQAKEFCDRAFKGPYSFAGERLEDPAPRGIIKRAERI